MAPRALKKEGLGREMSQLQNAVAIITGASSGIGRATALALARRGAKIVVVARDAQKLQAVADEIEALGSEALPYPGDVADPGLFEALRDATLAAFGRIDVIVNNPGAVGTGLPEDIPIEEWERAIDINLLSIVRSNRIFVPHLIAQGNGHIVNTASVDGLYGFGYDRLPYAATKAAVVQLSEGLALYLRPKGIGVSCLCPGPVDSDIGHSVRNFGRAHPMHGAGEELVSIPNEGTGDLVADAIAQNRFLVLTHPAEVQTLMKLRAEDMDAFIDRQIANPQIVYRYDPDA